MKRLLMTGLVSLAIGCGGGGGGDTDDREAAAQYAGPVASSDVARGLEVFNATCEACHADGPALQDIGWEPARVRQQIREGSGHMPSIGESRVSADDLEAVLAYLVTIGAVADEGSVPPTGGGEAPAAEEAPAEQ